MRDLGGLWLAPTPPWPKPREDQQEARPPSTASTCTSVRKAPWKQKPGGPEGAHHHVFLHRGPNRLLLSTGLLSQDLSAEFPQHRSEN